MEATARDTERLESEIEQGRKIADQAEEVWGYASPAGILRADRRGIMQIRHGRIEAESSVLEIGCGTGLITRRIAPTGARITATDLSSDLLVRGRELVAFENVVFQVANAEELPFAEEAFDVVLGNAILHHLDVVQALQEIRRVLKLGGRMVFTEPNMFNPQIVMQKNWGWLREKAGDTPDERAFFAWQIRRLLGELDFVDIRVSPFDFLHPVTPPILIPFIGAIGRLVEHIPLVRQIAGSLLIVGSKTAQA